MLKQADTGFKVEYVERKRAISGATYLRLRFGDRYLDKRCRTWLLQLRRSNLDSSWDKALRLEVTQILLEGSACTHSLTNAETVSFQQHVLDCGRNSDDYGRNRILLGRSIGRAPSAGIFIWQKNLLLGHRTFAVSAVGKSKRFGSWEAWL